MAVTRTVNELGADLRISSGNVNVSGAQLVVLNRIHATAKAMVEAYAPGAPEALQNEAFVRLAGWLYDADPSGANPGGPTALRSSGAASILGGHRAKRGGLIKASGVAAGTSPGTGTDLTGREIAALLDTFLGTQDWRTGGTVARVPAASEAVRGGVFGITDAKVDAETDTDWFAWTISHVKRLINRVVPAWARSASTTDTIPAGRLAVGATGSEKVPTTSVVGGKTVVSWQTPGGSHFLYGADPPLDTLHSIFTHYLRTSSPAEWWVRTGNPATWLKIYTFTSLPPELTALLDTLAGASGSGPGRVFTLDGQGANPSWQPPQGGVTIQQVLQQIANHAALEDAHQPREATWARQGNTDRAPGDKLGGEESGDSEYVLRRINGDSFGDWIGLNALMQKGAIRERIQDLVAAMFTGNSTFSYDDTDPNGAITVTFPTLSSSGNSWVLKFFRPGSAPSKIIAERVGHINQNGRFVPYTGIVPHYVGAGTNDWTIAVNSAQDFATLFANDLRFAGGGVSDYDDLTDKPVIRVSSVAAIPDPSASTNGHRYQTNNGELYRVEDIIIQGTDRVVTTALFPTDTTGTTGVRFQGSVDHFSDLPDTITVPDEGKWWFVRSTINNGESPFIEIDNQGRRKSSAHSPDGTHAYVGAWDSEAAAKASHEVTAAGQLLIYPDANGTLQVYEVQSGFVAGTPSHHTYGLVRQDVNSHLLARIDNLESGSAVEIATLSGQSGSSVNFGQAGINAVDSYGMLELRYSDSTVSQHCAYFCTDWLRTADADGQDRIVRIAALQIGTTAVGAIEATTNAAYTALTINFPNSGSNYNVTLVGIR